ncbi:hypothetical protein K1X12_07540 [Hyphomonas sp. WL0036]|uniref:hypothetical protein n=1 Tax=Hyphomonas sediminis TaxID=2866160 RepID=UPI001C80ED11|nr:hypothetical protein [Hyphomonas sediminis]MBY9066748.1 hypothetical protein [Hyphomonas sediminis]
MSKLTFEIKPSPSTNDHEVLVLVDGKTVLGEDHMGIDPREFFAQFISLNTDQLLVGRCQCGTVGCDDYFIAVETTPDYVLWKEPKVACFDRSEYEGAVREASRDFSWEDGKRRAERLTEEILGGRQTEDGFAFQWASARIAPLLMKLSFIKEGQQKLLEFAWDGATDESVVEGARQFKRQLAEQ